MQEQNKAPEKPLEELVMEEIQKLRQTEQENNQQQEGKYELNVAGKKLVFNSQAELEKFVEGLATGGTNKAQAQPGTTVTAQDMDQPPATPEIPKVDLDTYAKLLQENPVLAHAYINRMLYGGVDPAAALAAVAARTAALESAIAAYQFREDHPEFKRCPENAQTLLNIIRQHNLPVTYDSLEMAYAFARQHNLLVSDEQPEKQKPAPSVEKPAPPPQISRRSGGFQTDFSSIVEQAEELDADQIAAIIRKLERGG